MWPKLIDWYPPEINPIDLTDWYPGYVLPVRVGIYIRGYGSYAYFSGRWYLGGDTLEEAEVNFKCLITSMLSDLPWRGLAEDPNKEKDKQNV